MREEKDSALMSMVITVLCPVAGHGLLISHVLGINVSYLQVSDGRFVRLIFPFERQLAE